MSNPLYQQLKRQQEVQNKENNGGDKKGGVVSTSGMTIPVKNIKQRICGIGIKENVVNSNSNGNNFNMGQYNNMSNNNNNKLTNLCNNNTNTNNSSLMTNISSNKRFT